MAEEDPDTLDGCDLVLEGPGDRATADEDVDALALFADVQFDDPAEVAQRVAGYEELFGDGS